MNPTPERPRGRRWNRRWLLLLLIPLVVVGWVVASVVYTSENGPTVVRTCTHPASLTYPNEAVNAPYSVFFTVDIFPFGWNLHGMAGDDPSYGVSLDIHTHESHVEDIECTWTTKGVTVTEPNGRVHTVSADQLASGR